MRGGEGQSEAEENRGTRKRAEWREPGARSLTLNPFSLTTRTHSHARAQSQIQVTAETRPQPMTPTTTWMQRRE
jgi:hypothetical protein